MQRMKNNKTSQETKIKTTKRQKQHTMFTATKKYNFETMP